jgi:hypothetical protein
MKKYSILLFILLTPASLFSQSNDSTCHCQPAPPGLISNSLQSKDFNKIIVTQFSNLISGQSKNSIGNFASIDLSKPELSFAGTLIPKTGHVITVKASGGVNDAFFEIFKNSKLNTQISLDVKYDLMLGIGKKRLEFNTDSMTATNNKALGIAHAYLLKANEIRFKRDSIQLEVQRQKINSQISDLEYRRDTSNGSARDDLNFEIGKRNIILDSILFALQNPTYCSEQCQAAYNKALLDMEGLRDKLPISGVRLNWITVGYKVSNNKFKLFNPAASFDAQVLDTSYVSHEARFQYSVYDWTSENFKSHYWSIGSALSFTDNFSDLKKKEISETKQYNPVTDARTVVKKYNAYEGAYTKEIKGLKLFADYYHFLFNDNIAAIHMNPEWVLKSDSKPIGNVQTGFLFVFKDTKTDGAIVTAELYYKFLDIFKTSEEDYRLFERNSIGISFSIPLKFNYSKK